jgi:hypothetical protein
MICLAVAEGNIPPEEVTKKTHTKVSFTRHLSFYNVSPI